MVNELESTLKQTLNLNNPTSHCVLQIVLLVISLRTVNLKRLACGMKEQALLDSQYRRLQRLFAKLSFPLHVFAQLIAGLFFA